MKIKILIAILSINLSASVAFPGQVKVSMDTGMENMKLIGDEHFYWYEKEGRYYRYDKTIKKYLPIMIDEEGDINIDNIRERSSSFNSPSKNKILKKATKKDLYKIWSKKRRKNHAIIK